MSDEGEGGGGPVIIDPKISALKRAARWCWDEFKPLLGIALVLILYWWLRYRVMPIYMPNIGFDGESDLLHAIMNVPVMLIVTMGAWFSSKFNHVMLSDLDERALMAMPEFAATSAQSWFKVLVLMRDCLILAFWGVLWFLACV